MFPALWRKVMVVKQKLELTWIGKNIRPKLEPRILIENPEKSYHAKHKITDNDIYDNILIHGDNLLTLKALEQEFAGKVKCIYIDPPYNTGNAFEHYDDGLEHSIWLGLMRERFEILWRILNEEGTFFCQLSDDEMAYGKVLLDEIFGRANFINQVSVKMKHTAGASGGGEDKRLKKNIEYILIYAKDYNRFQKFNEVYDEVNLFDLIDEMEANDNSWKYTSIILGKGDFVEERTILDGSGDPITVKKYKGLKRTTVSAIEREGLPRENVYWNYFDSIFSDTNAQTSIRTRIIDEFVALDNDELLIASYVPKTGRDKNKTVEHFYLSPSIRRVIWLKDSTEKRGNLILKKEKAGTFWSGFPLNNLTKEGGVKFPNGKKPEALLQRIFDLATNPGDLVLDSFLGSGTMAAVAHKMRLRWIGIELGEHCYTHCLPRLKKVIDGEDKGGITEAVSWHGGGGFRFYELGPSLIKEDAWGNPVINPEFNAAMLGEAMCKLEGFIYAPSNELYFIHGYSTENDFIYITTNFMTHEMLVAISEKLGAKRTLLICCRAYKGATDRFNNLTIKKIPASVLEKCEGGHDDYSLEIKNLPQASPQSEPVLEVKRKNRKLFGVDNTPDLFGSGCE